MRTYKVYKILAVSTLTICFFFNLLPLSTRTLAANIDTTASQIDFSQEPEDVPLPLNQEVMEMIKFFQTERRGQIQKALSKMDQYLPMFKQILKEEGVPEVLAYLPFIESAYDPIARSNVGARGIWQFMPSTGRRYGLRVDSWVDERIHPEKSCRAAARYLKNYYNKFGNWTLAVAAYNAGPTRINRAVRKLKTSDFWKIKKSRYIRSQTKRYIPAFIAGVHIARSPYNYGFLYISHSSPEYETVTIPESTDLAVIAKCIGTDTKTLHNLNPELKRSVTPYNYTDYELRIPVGTKSKFDTEFVKIPASERLVKTYHKVRRGDTLSQIATKYGTSVRDLMKANGLTSAHRLSVGKTLLVPLIPGYTASDLKSYNTGYTPRSRYSAGQKLTHKVRWGDSLYKIANRYRTDIHSICQWNSIDTNTVIKPGMYLTVYYKKRVGSDTTVQNSFPTGEHLTYVVRKGDSLFSIARRHNTTIKKIKAANNMRGSRLYPGDKLLIPR
jgi:membrane-bound lytic murein transglycosylase D